MGKWIWAAVLAAPLALTACGEGAGGDAAAPETDRWGQSEPADAVFTVLTGGTAIGAVEVWRGEAGYTIGFEFRDNGRGPTFQEDIRLDAAGHPAHEKGDAQRVAGEARREVDVVEGQLGQRVMEQVDLFEEGRALARFDVAALAEFDVVDLSLSDAGGLGHSGLRGREVRGRGGS
jgi:hypothetical protein